jgi:outer membrane protein TolC
MKHVITCGWGPLVLGILAITANAGGSKDDDAKELKRLLLERHETLRKAADVLRVQYQNGRIPFGSVIQVQRDFLKATLELPQSAEKRRAALEEYRQFAEQTLKIAQALFEGGQAIQADVLEAQAALLEFRIELIREKLKATSRK